jgi:hypothetical protein
LITGVVGIALLTLIIGVLPFLRRVISASAEDRQHHASNHKQCQKAHPFAFHNQSPFLIFGCILSR